MSIFYINGNYVNEEDANVPARDLAVLRGYGAFDFLRTYGGKPFRLNKNIGRLRRSCEIIELDFPWTDEEVSDIVDETIKRNADESDEFNIRLVVTGGVSSDNITPDGESTLLVMVQPLKPLPDWWYNKGVKVVTVDVGRVFPKAKSIIYTPAIIAQKRAKAAGGVEALYTDEENNVTEGTTTNVFAIYGNTIITPEEGNLLPGITRKTVIDLIKESGMTLEIRALPYDELLQADEMFITAANKQIVPVVTVDDTTIGDGKVGEGTQHIMALFKAFTEKRAAGTLI